MLYKRKYLTEFNWRHLGRRRGSRSHHQGALKIKEAFGKQIGCLVKIILFVYYPDAIVFGGSIANAYPYFEKAMRREMESFDFPETKKISPSSFL